MALEQPTTIPTPWASGGAYADIPKDPAAGGRASWSAGFPPETARPISAGGIPPNWLDFQGVLHALSSHAVFQQSGARYQWSPDLDYPAGACVLDADGTVWQALANSGPGYAAGAKDPRNGANPSFWGCLALPDGVSIVVDASGRLSIGNADNATATAFGTSASRKLSVRFADIANVRDFGAKGDGETDDRAAIKSAILSGKKVYIPEGVYLIDSSDSSSAVISIASDSNIDVVCDQNAVIKIGNSIASLTAGVFNCQTNSPPSKSSRTTFSWIGGHFDASGLTSSPSYGLTLINIFQYSGFCIRDVDFYCGFTTPNGTDIGTGVCDTAITCHNCWGGVIDNCSFTGFYDCGVYISGNLVPEVYDEIGEAQVVSNCRFRRCANGITLKRNHVGQFVVSNLFYECANGVLASTVGSTADYGQSATIIGNRFKRIQGRPVYLRTGMNYAVIGNIIEDFAKLLSDSTTDTSISTGNNIAGVDLSACSGAVVSGNVISQLDFASTNIVGADKCNVGIALKTVAVGDTIGSTERSIISDNFVSKTQGYMLEDAGCTRNYYENNIYLPNSSGSAYRAMINGGGVFVGEPLVASVSTNLTSIPASGGYQIDLDCPGAKKGDFIDSVSTTDSTQGLMLYPYINEDDKVRIAIFNPTVNAINLGTITYKVVVRKSD